MAADLVGDDKDLGGEVMGAQDRPGDIVEVAVGIIEADQHRPSRERLAGGEMAGDVVRRHGVIAVAPRPAHLLGEGRRRLAIAAPSRRGHPRRCDV